MAERISSSFDGALIHGALFVDRRLMLRLCRSLSSGNPYGISVEIPSHDTVTYGQVERNAEISIMPFSAEFQIHASGCGLRYVVSAQTKRCKHVVKGLHLLSEKGRDKTKTANT